MLELTGSQFEKGLLELRFEKREKGPKKWLLSVAPNLRRVMALSIFLLSALLTYQRQPGLFFFERAWVNDSVGILQVQNVVTWSLMGIGLVIYFSVFVLRKVEVTLIFDRAAKLIRYEVGSAFMAQPPRQGLIPFGEIEVFRVYGAKSKPQTPHGYVEIGREKGNENFKFRLLSDDQIKIYPLNISRILDRNPTGDWVDPDAEISPR